MNSFHFFCTARRWYRNMIQFFATSLNIDCIIGKMRQIRYFPFSCCVIGFKRKWITCVIDKKLLKQVILHKINVILLKNPQFSERTQFLATNFVIYCYQSLYDKIIDNNWKFPHFDNTKVEISISNPKKNSQGKSRVE